MHSILSRRLFSTAAAAPPSRSMMQSIGHVFSSVGSGFVKYKQNLFICVLGSALASLSWRLSTNKQSHIAAMEVKDRELNSMRAELSQLRSEHTAQQQQLSRAVDARETVLSLLDAFKSNIKARDAPQKFDVLRRAVADTMPTIQSADAFEKYLDQSFAADATSASPASPAQPKKSAYSGVI